MRLIIRTLLPGLIFTELALVAIYWSIPLDFMPTMLKQYYMESRDVIQFNLACSRYDSYLFYTLKPGSCRFTNREFDTTYSVNSLGVRDDEESLHSPDIVVIGDSFAMGWGVEQSETFSSVLEHKSHLKVLDAGVSSYGTVRELALLRRIDTSALRLLIIQYSENDNYENNRLANYSVSSESQFLKYTKRHHYWPGNILWSCLRSAFNLSTIKKLNYNDETAAEELERIARQKASSFWNVMNSMLDIDSSVQIVMLEINGRNRNDSLFVREIQRTASENRVGQNLAVIDSSLILKDSHYFHLDDHLNKLGHYRIALELEKFL